MKRTLNILLTASLLLTLSVPLTGLIVHKMASALFLLLCAVHTAVYRKKLRARGLALAAVVLIAFVSGVFSLVFDGIPAVLALHKIVSLTCVAALAVHIFCFHRRMLRSA